MNQTCGEHDVRCGVLDEVRARRWQPDDFIDEGHFSGKGGQAFAQLVAERIQSYAASHHLRHQGAATTRTARAGG